MAALVTVWKRQFEGWLVEISLDIADVAKGVLKNMKMWWRGEITGKRCVKNILSVLVCVAGEICES